MGELKGVNFEETEDTSMYSWFLLVVSLISVKLFVTRPVARNEFVPDPTVTPVGSGYVPRWVHLSPEG